MKGLPVLIGLALVILNFFVQFVPFLAPIARINLLLHLGVVVAIGGILVGDVL